jgi:hypothetical protein
MVKVGVLYIKIWEDGSCKMFGCISFGRNLKLHFDFMYCLSFKNNAASQVTSEIIFNIGCNGHTNKFDP